MKLYLGKTHVHFNIIRPLEINYCFDWHNGVGHE